MLISLITVSYNACDSLEETIKSVRAQEFKDFEYIIIDGGSKDNTSMMVKDYQDLISLYVSEPDGGIYEALNKGLSYAKGRVIGFIHANDRFANTQVLSKIASLFDKENPDVVYGDLQYVSSFEPLQIFRNWKSGNFDASKVRRGWMPPHPSVYFSREVLQKVGDFDTSYKISADYEWLLRLMLREDITLAYLPEVLVYMAIGGASNRSLKGIIQKSREDYRAIRKNKAGGLFTLLSKNFSKLGQFFSGK